MIGLFNDMDLDCNCDVVTLAECVDQIPCCNDNEINFDDAA